MFYVWISVSTDVDITSLQSLFGEGVVQTSVSATFNVTLASAETFTVETSGIETRQAESVVISLIDENGVVLASNEVTVTAIISQFVIL